MHPIFGSKTEWSSSRCTCAARVSRQPRRDALPLEHDAREVILSKFWPVQLVADLAVDPVLSTRVRYLLTCPAVIVNAHALGDQDRSVGSVDDLVVDAPAEQRAQAGGPARTHHNQVGIPITGQARDVRGDP